MPRKAIGRSGSNDKSSSSKRGKYIGGSTRTWSPERRAKFVETLARKKAEAALRIAKLPESQQNGAGNRKLELINKILDAPDNILDTIEKVLKVA